MEYELSDGSPLAPAAAAEAGGGTDCDRCKGGVGVALAGSDTESAAGACGGGGAAAAAAAAGVPGEGSGSTSSAASAVSASVFVLAADIAAAAGGSLWTAHTDDNEESVRRMLKRQSRAERSRGAVSTERCARGQCRSVITRAGSLRLRLRSADGCRCSIRTCWRQCSMLGNAADDPGECNAECEGQASNRSLRTQHRTRRGSEHSLQRSTVQGHSGAHSRLQLSAGEHAERGFESE